MSTTSQHTERTVARLITAQTQQEGGGFLVRRPLPSRRLPDWDPFLLIDELGPVSYGPGEALGAPDHPHRGFETITYLLDGEVHHRDSAGHRGTLKAGDVQWMTAGAGVVHSEMPSPALLEHGGRMHGFQIWVNLPASLKMTAPRYQEVPSRSIPSAVSEDGLTHVTVIAGTALGVTAVIDTHTPLLYQDWTLQPGADITANTPATYRVGLYVFSGSVRIGPQPTDAADVHDGQLALLGEGTAVRLHNPAHASEPARLLMLGGTPIDEPVARSGPFVMNTHEELQQAVRDYQNGRMGRITT